MLSPYRVLIPIVLACPSVQASESGNDAQETARALQICASNYYANLLLENNVKVIKYSSSSIVDSGSNAAKVIRVASPDYELLIEPEHGCLVEFTSSKRSDLRNPNKKISEMGDAVRKYIESLDFLAHSGLGKIGIDFDLGSPDYFDNTALVLFPRVFKGIEFLDERVSYAFDKDLTAITIKHISAVVTFGPIPGQVPAVNNQTIVDSCAHIIQTSPVVSSKMKVANVDLSPIDKDSIKVGRLMYVHENRALTEINADLSSVRNNPLHLCYQCEVKITGMKVFRIYIDASSGVDVAGEFSFYR